MAQGHVLKWIGSFYAQLSAECRVYLGGAALYCKRPMAMERLCKVYSMLCGGDLGCRHGCDGAPHLRHRVLQDREPSTAENNTKLGRMLCQPTTDYHNHNPKIEYYFQCTYRMLITVKSEFFLRDDIMHCPSEGIVPSLFSMYILYYILNKR
jgi:hypothetical protein